MPTRCFYTAVITIAVALFSVGARAADNACQPVAAVQAQLAPILGPIHGEVIVLMGADAVAYLEIVNAQPPVTHLAGDGVLLAVVPGAAVTVGVIKDGLACAVGHIAAELHARALEAVAGHKA